MSVLFHLVMELQFQVHIVQNFHDLNFSDWSNNRSSRNCCKVCGLDFTRENNYFLHTGINCPKPSSSGRVLWLIPDANPMHENWIPLSRTVIRSPECFPAFCFQMLVLEETPKSSLLVNSRSSVFLCPRILFFFFETSFLSILVRCQTELFTPIRNCSDDTELIYRMNDSE